MTFYVYLTPGNDLWGQFVNPEEAQRSADEYNNTSTDQKAFVSKVWIMKNSINGNYG